MNQVPFGKHAGEPISSLVKDRKYLDWLTRQPWFQFAVAVSRQPWFDRIAGKTAAASQQEGD